jgi:precorrin-6A synthase
MRKILIIGIGPGQPDYVTAQAIEALNRADVFFIPDKGEEKEVLARLRLDICQRYVKNRNYRFAGFAMPERGKDPEDYEATVRDWHERIAERYQTLIAQGLDDGECGAFLVWGDPALYDSTLRIVETIKAKGRLAFDYEVIPGISSVQALAARHRIALNRIGGSVHITTGRKLRQGFPGDTDSVVVMLDGEQAFKTIDDDDIEIYWGAYVGTPDEILVSGRLADVAGKIEAIRAAARRDKGWIMDIYLLRKSGAK